MTERGIWDCRYLRRWRWTSPSWAPREPRTPRTHTAPPLNSPSFWAAPVTLRRNVSASTSELRHARSGAALSSSCGGAKVWQLPPGAKLSVARWCVVRSHCSELLGCSLYIISLHRLPPTTPTIFVLFFSVCLHCVKKYDDIFWNQRFYFERNIAVLPVSPQNGFLSVI